MIKKIWVFAVLLSFITANMSAFDWDFTISSGISFPGTIKVKDDIDNESWNYDLTKPTALLVKTSLDVYPISWLGGSLFLYAGSAPLKEELSLGFWDGKEHILPASGISILEIGGALKTRIESGENIYIKPSVGWGYLHSFSDSPDARMDGFVMNFELEYEHPLYSIYSGTIQFGCAVQPYGGVKDVAYVTFGPLFYITLGLLI